MKNKGVIELSIGTIVIIVLAMSMLILGLVLVRSIFDEPHFRIYLNETEVDEINICCLNTKLWTVETLSLLGTLNDTLPPSSWVNMFCMPEENLEFFNVSCEPLKKEDLTIGWLDVNCLCQDCEGTWDMVYDDYVTCDIKCSKYKFGNYTIEVWNQIK